MALLTGRYQVFIPLDARDRANELRHSHTAGTCTAHVFLGGKAAAPTTFAPDCKEYMGVEDQCFSLCGKFSHDLPSPVLIGREEVATGSTTTEVPSENLTLDWNEVSDSSSLKQLPTGSHDRLVGASI